MPLLVFIAAIAVVASLLLLVLAVWFLVEIVAGRHQARTPWFKGEPAPFAVVIPAHNEGEALTATLRDVKGQLRGVDRLIVVADNCTDDTAAIARREGAEVLERHDGARRGKGYALQFALDHLRQDPPGCVLFTDADCLHSEGLLQGMATEALLRRCPVQALYLMQAAEGAPPARKVAAFAWRLINKTRQEGLARLAGATRLTGAGAAFPWPVADTLELGSGEIVEDLGLTLALAQRGVRVPLVSDHVVTSHFPESDEAARIQRARWEHGSLGMIRKRVPRLLLEGLRTPWKLALALDVAVPPLTVFAVLLSGAGLAGVVLALLGKPATLLIASLAAAAFGGGLVIAYLKDGRAVLPPEELRALSGFLLSKLGVYGRQGRASARAWTRTPRDSEKR